MAQLNREILSNILTKQRSPPFVKRLNKCEGLTKTNRRKNKRILPAETALRQRKEFSVSLDEMGFGIEIILREDALGADAAFREVLQGCKREYEEFGLAVLERSDPFCGWLEDREMHVQMILDGSRELMPLLDDTLNRGGSREFLKSTADRYMQFTKEVVALQRILGHTLIACGALNIQKPEYLTSLISSRMFLVTLGSIPLQKYEQQEWLLKRVPNEEIVLELLRMLYPHAWKSKFEECTGRKIVAPKQQKEKLSRGHKQLASRLRMEFPDEEFDREDVQELGGICRWKDDKAVEVARLGIEGIEIEDAVFLAESDSSEQTIQNHIMISPVLELEGLAHEDVHWALEVLTTEQAEAFGEALEAYSGWKKLMPGSWGEENQQKMSAVLALSDVAPQNRKEVHEKLQEADDSIIEVLLETEDHFGYLSNLLEDYCAYAEGFVKREEDCEEVEDEAVEVPEKVRMRRPHESLSFSRDVEQYIESKGILVENVKRAIIYGLRLSSRKSAIGGKYFPISAFRHNVRTVLSKEGGNPEERVKVVEDFLYKEGIISYYKQGDVVKLNLKDEIGQHHDPSEVGQQILDSVISWKVEFDRRTKGNGS